MRSKQEVYQALLGQTLWVRGGFAASDEEGHTFLYRPFGGLARRQNLELVAAAKGIQTEFIELLGQAAALPTCMLNGEDPQLVLRRLLGQMSDVRQVVFEGYAFNARHEGSEANEGLAAIAEQAGLPVILSNATAADYWNDKRNFRRHVERLYGASAIPVGQEWAKPTVGQLAAFAQERFQAGVERVVFKASGMGGFANLILTPTDDLVSRLTEFLAHRLDESQTWVVGEEWRPWLLSPCTSFFSDGVNEPVWMEMSEQNLNPVTAGFIGGRSFVNLSATDQQALVDYLRPVAAEIYQAGVRGFIGFDVILCPPRAEDALRLPDSNLAVVLIEVNARLNGHNQERLFCALLAERESLMTDDLVHLRVGTKSLLGLPNRAAVKTYFAGLLAGLAEPLTTQSLGTNDVRFVLDVCRGEQASVYDGILLVGRKSAAVQETIMASAKVLQDAGVTKF